MVEVRDIAEGLWLWRQAHPAWRPGLDWEPEVSSFVVETKGEVVLLDPLAPRPSEQAVWSRFKQAPPTAAVWPWSLGLGFDQAQVIEGHWRQLVRSGQDAVGADGQPQHRGDMAAQLELALDNLEAVLAAGEMTLANIARLNVYTTEVDDLFKHWGTVKDRLAHADGRFATSVVGVTRLAAPQLLVLLEATAFD